MGYFESYKAIFDRLKEDLEIISGLAVILGGPFHLDVNLPCAIINPAETIITSEDIGGDLYNRIGIEVIVIIRETEPEDWFVDVIAQMGPIVDRIMEDRELNNLALDIMPTAFIPGEVKFQSKIYYGGVVRFEVLAIFHP